MSSAESKDSSLSATMSTAKPDCILSKSAGSSSEKPPASQNQPSTLGQVSHQNQQLSDDGAPRSSSSEGLLASLNQLSSKNQRPRQNQHLPDDSTLVSSSSEPGDNEPLRVLPLVTLFSDFEKYGIQWWQIGLYYHDSILPLLERTLSQKRESVQEQQLFEQKLFEPQNNTQTVGDLFPESSMERLIIPRRQGFQLSTQTHLRTRFCETQMAEISFRL